MDARDILIKPIVTEKSTALMEEGKYTFQVPLNVTKIEIRQAVEPVSYTHLTLPTTPYV